MDRGTEFRENCDASSKNDHMRVYDAEVTATAGARACRRQADERVAVWCGESSSSR